MTIDASEKTRSSSLNRRAFIKNTGLALSGGLSTHLLANPIKPPIYGQGDFRYEQVPGWGLLDPEVTPVNNCHGLAHTRDGHIILLTDHSKNSVIVYDRAGNLQHKWGTQFPKAHGLTLQEENGKEVLYITDLTSHAVYKTSLDGEILQQWDAPLETPFYHEAKEYRPSWTLHFTDGGFLVLDGYGKDYFIHYDARGNLQEVTGGKEGGIPHFGPHGGLTLPGKEEVLIAMSDRQYLLRMTRKGSILEQIDLPGGNPRSVKYHKGHYFIPHLADNWPADRNSRGFISVLNRDLQVVSNIAGTPPTYDGKGKLKNMKTSQPLFLHPHDVIVDGEDSLYCAQFNSGQTTPIKLVRV